jgi:RND family efflux transporter MFP subunit
MNKIFRIGVPALGVASLVFVGSCRDARVEDPRDAPLTVAVAAVEPAAEPIRSFTGTIVARVQSTVGFPVDLDLAAAANAANVTALRAILVQAEADERRMAELLKTAAVSIQSHDAAKAVFERTQAQLAAAEAQAEVSANQKNYTFLRADSDGVILDTSAEPGQVVEAGQAVLRLAHDGPREAAVDLPEDVRPAIGSAASAVLYGSDDELNASLRQLSEAADPLSRTFEARYVLPEQSANVPVGSTVVIRLRLDQGRAPGSVTVPATSIYDRGNGPGVWILNGNNTVSYRTVRIGRLGRESITLAEGATQGERIIALGAHLLHEGQQVEPKP